MKKAGVQENRFSYVANSDRGKWRTIWDHDDREQTFVGPPLVRWALKVRCSTAGAAGRGGRDGGSSSHAKTRSTFPT